jgi:hypothetical protein
MTIKLLTANDLRPGVRFKYSGHPVEILRDREKRKNQFGLELDSWWSRRIDTGDEGYVSLGPGGVLGVEPLKTSPAKLDREIAESLKKKTTLRRSMITEEQARSMPRFEFIAHWLVVVTKKKENRGPLGLYVKRVGKRWQIVSPIGGGTVTFETPDPALLFDYARRGQLGPHIRDAEEFRGLAYERAGVT